MSDIELLQDCIKTLSNITIPCGLVKQVGVPVAAVAEQCTITRIRNHMDEAT